MSTHTQDEEVDRNYAAFTEALASLLREHRDEFALMRHAEIVAFHPSAGEALRDGRRRFGSNVFSIQEVTDVPIDLGFFRHAVRPRLA